MATVKRTISFAAVASTPQVKSLHGAIDFEYNDADPLAVRLHFHDGHEIVTWAFARDLLADGLTGAAGIYDVCCWTSGAWFHIGLSSPDGKATYKVIAEQVRAFLIDTEELVGYGDEEDIVNAELDNLLKDGAR